MFRRKGGQARSLSDEALENELEWSADQASVLALLPEKVLAQEFARLFDRSEVVDALWEGKDRGGDSRMGLARKLVHRDPGRRSELVSRYTANGLLPRAPVDPSSRLVLQFHGIRTYA